MKIFVEIAIFLLLLSPPASRGQQEATCNGDCAARVGDQVISRNELQQVLADRRQAGDVQQVLATLTPEGKERVLQQLVGRKLFSLAARQRGGLEDEQVQLAIQRAVDAILAEFFVKQEVGGLDLSELALKGYYQANPTEFRTGRRVHARHIITGTAQEAAAGLQQVRQGKDFSQVAAEYNIDSTKDQNGDLGWVKRGVMVKSFDEVLFSLEQGEISDVVQTRYGFHIILAEEIDQGRAIPFEAVKKQIKQKMVSRHLTQVKEKLREIYPVRINRKVLAEPEM